MLCLIKAHCILEFLGEKLAENNGKMSKELKRLKKLLAEQDQLAKKLAQSDVDKELAKEEIRALTAENNKLRGNWLN